jgi:uncharacterized protein YkwD
MRRPLLLAGAVGLLTVAAGVVVATNASAGTSTYEAEATTNTLVGGARKSACDRCSARTKVGWVGYDGVLTFTGVTAERAGSTTVSLTYASGERRTALLSVNDAPSIAITFPSTRGFDRPATIRLKVTLKSGTNTLAFGNPTGWAPDFDKLVVATDGTPPPPVPTATSTGAPATADPSTPVTEAPSTPPVPDPTTTGAPTPDPTTPPATPAPTPTAPPTTPPPSPTTGPTATPSPTGNAALEAAVLEIVNTERAKAGCAPVANNDKLTAAARGHSADMAARNYFSHTTPEGVDFVTRINNTGYRWSGAGENIAKGQRTPADVMNAWMNSAGHKANILNCGFKDLGVGVAADSSGTLLWTQDFGTPR